MSDLDYDYDDYDGESDSVCRRGGSDSGSVLESGEESDRGYADERGDDIQGKVVLPRLQMCSVHKPGFMVEIQDLPRSPFHGQARSSKGVDDSHACYSSGSLRCQIG